GGPSLAFAAFVDGGCEGATVSWSSSDGQSSAGPSFAWTPPATSCNAAGEVVTLTATATWTSGAPSSESTQVTLEPWGAPLPPVFAPASQDAGTTRVWGPAGAEHVCSASGGFPGTELLWAAIDAGPFSFRLVDGGLELSTPECLSGQFVATARRQVVGEQRGRVSDVGTLVVDVRANLAPLDATTPFVVTAGADAGVLEGTLQATASCADQRGLTSEVTVFDGPTSVASGVFAVPGGWALPVPGGCAGGVRDVVARLLEDGGFTGAEHRAQVSLERTPVAVGPQRLERTTATCGVGVRARVELEPVAGACAAVDTSWRVVAGPDVLVSAGSGAAFELQTVRGDLSATGQSFTIEWTVDGGGTNVLSETRTLAVEAEPFVSLSVASSPALRTEEGATFYEVTLSNGTACEVGELVLELPLTAALPLAETVRVDGAVKPAMLEGAALRVEELSLPASGQTVVRFGARARLLGTPSVSPVVTLHGVPVSVAAAPTGFQAGGCGCSSGGAPFAVLAFAALVLRRRRR
ncbi:MAG: MYXO-CTERM sorting domain-containing protein, partial [Myxococcota bacterium]